MEEISINLSAKKVKAKVNEMEKEYKFSWTDEMNNALVYAAIKHKVHLKTDVTVAEKWENVKTQLATQQEFNSYKEVCGQSHSNIN